MDIYRFINSNAIREHLKKLDYQFNTLEAAWLVWQCENAALAEKHAAWRKIIDTMPDMPIEWEAWPAPRESMHHFLKVYITMEERWVTEILNPPSQVVFRGELGRYASFSQLLAKDVAEGQWVTMEYIGRDRIILFDHKEEQITKVKAVDELSSKEDCMLQAFPALWFAFPTPFQVGDILAGDIGSFDSGIPFVLSNPVARKQGFDGSDMVAYGWFQDDKGVLHSECVHRYMNLEYAPKEGLMGSGGVLTALSNHLRGEIDAVLFARAYHQILTEEYAKKLIPNDITKEGLMLAGIQTASPDDDDEREEKKP